MRAIRLHAFGPTENLVWEEVDDPIPGEGQVCVDVAAAGVHLIDTTLRRGQAAGPAPLPALPATPGREVAGTVSSVGPGVDPAWAGREVVAHLGPNGSGGYAERVLAPAQALHVLPDGLSAEVAVAMIGTGRTALGIWDSAAVTAEDTVLVLAAAGGLGSLFLQAARNTGAWVAGLAGGPAKVTRVAELGADAAVDYRAEDWPERVRAELGERRLDVVLDGVGGATGRAALELLDPGGRMIMYGHAGGQEPTRLSTQDLVERGLSATWALGPHLARRAGGIRALEERALEEAATRRLVPQLTRFPLSQAARAHRALESRETTGKVVLTP